MNDFIYKKVKVLSTRDCIDLINSEYYVSDWKRVTKFNLIEGSIRVFKDKNNDYISVFTIDSKWSKSTKLYKADLSILKNNIIELQKIAKFYYGHDYNEIYLNPLNNHLYCVGGDGGWCYAPKLSKKQMDVLDDNDEIYESSNPNIFEEGELGYLEMNQHPNTKWITNVEWEAECNPEEDSEYIKVAEYQTIN